MVVKRANTKAGARRLSNEVLRKIRIAMGYKDDDMIAVLKLADFRISKGELSAFLESGYRNLNRRRSSGS